MYREGKTEFSLFTNHFLRTPYKRTESQQKLTNAKYEKKNPSFVVLFEIMMLMLTTAVIWAMTV